jgi:hypothetical protein
MKRWLDVRFLERTSEAREPESADEGRADVPCERGYFRFWVNGLNRSRGRALRPAAGPCQQWMERWERLA